MHIRELLMKAQQDDLLCAAQPRAHILGTGLAADTRPLAGWQGAATKETSSDLRAATAFA
jgi:hypothetical protein